MVAPIRTQHDVSLAYRRRSRRSRRPPYRPLWAALVVLALAGGGFVLDRALDAVPVRAAAPARGAARPVPAAPAPPAAKASGGVRLGLAGLEPSACLAYAPTAGDAGKTVFLDPGHGGPDPGAIGVAAGRQVREKDATLAVATQLAGMLRARGYRVVLARSQDTLVTRLTDDDLDQGALRASAERRDLLARIACANAARATLLLAIHFNGFEDPDVGGSEVFYDAARPFADQNRQLALLLQARLVKSLGVDDRGVQSDDELDAPTLSDAAAAYGHLMELGPAAAGYVDVPTAMPGALAEPLFITNPDEAQKLIGADGRRQVAGALAAGLLSFLEGAA